MAKNTYHIQVENTADPTQTIAFDFENHDDLFHIIHFMKTGGRFASEEEAVRFAVGLKLFSGVLMANRDNELFKDFEPAFMQLMRKLKGH